MKKKYILLIEIIVWLLILSGSFYFLIYNSAIKENAQNSYYLFFDDVEGLVKGSPVRLMGINIGYIRDIKIFDNKVFVSFLVTKNNVKIPQKAIATIEFYGLGGSTSLELRPDIFSETDEEIITPVESYRIQDFWDGQKLVSNVMIDIYGSVGRTIDRANLIENKQWFKQSSLVEKITQQTGLVNSQQSVLIYKLSEATFKYSRNNKQDKTNTLSKFSNEKETEVQTND